MVTVYLEKHGKVLVGNLEDERADCVLDYLSNEGRGEVCRMSSKDIFGVPKKQRMERYYKQKAAG